MHTLTELMCRKCASTEEEQCWSNVIDTSCHRAMDRSIRPSTSARLPTRDALVDRHICRSPLIWSSSEMLAVHESVEDVSIDKRNCKQRSVSTEQVNDTYDRRDVLTK
jgi:hypothetical protein